jgi:hypothetical protein
LPKEISGHNRGILRVLSSPNLELTCGEFWPIFLPKMRPNHLGDIFQKKCAKRQKNAPKLLNFAQSGTDVMIFKIFSPKNLAKQLAFWTQNKAKF